MYDVIIIGGGVCGLSAGMYAGRLGMKTLVLEGEVWGGTITTTNIVENWPGIKSISGEDLAMQVLEHAKEYEIDIKRERVTEVKRNGEKGCFVVTTGDGAYDGVTVIFATGTKHKKLPAKNAVRFENKGVHYCALCDGPLYSGKEVAVIGGGDSAAKEALLLSDYTEKVYLLVRDEKLRAEPVNVERVKKNKKIEVMTKVSVVEIIGSSRLEALVLDKRDGGKDELKVDAAFVAIGLIPLSEVAEKMGVKVNERKEIVIDRRSATDIEGVFACGDVTDTKFKQAITGAGEAVTAAYWAYTYVNESEYVCPRGEEKP